MAKELEPIICHDGKEFWILYPEDNAYLLVSKVKTDEDGVRHVEPEMVEMLKGWWYHQAIERAEKAVAALEIPWDELHVTGEEAEEGNLAVLSKKLAVTSYHIVQVNNVLSGSAVRLAAAKEAVEQAVHQMIASRDSQDGEGRRPPIAVRIAALIHQHKPLRNGKIEIIESTAAMKALEQTKESLDVIWRTASRLISTRLKEPID